VADFDASGSIVGIQRWVNLNLLADGADSQSQTRCACGGPASWSDIGTLLCKKCAKKRAKPCLELTNAKLPEWRTWAESVFGPESKKLSKASLIEKAATIRLMPYKAPKAKGVTLQTLLASMEKCLSAELVHLATTERIRIENQPSEFAPHMKSIQIMLFTLLDHRLRTEHAWTGTMEFVNASVKTRGTDASTGKEGKRSRKLAGMERVQKVLTEKGLVGDLVWWNEQAKKDDLADALLMCLDAN
jgi:hypothetical protein